MSSARQREEFFQRQQSDLMARTSQESLKKEIEGIREALESSRKTLSHEQVSLKSS